MREMLRSLKQTAKSFITRGFFLVNGGRERATCRLVESADLSGESMVLAYMQGLFPLGQPDGQIHWQSPAERAVIGIDEVHVSKRLKTYLKKESFDICFNERFAEVVVACADREETWINQPLIEVYQQLHLQQIGHSVEAYQNGELVGGGFGLSIGNVFFLESMFCRVDQASKVAFVKLADQLKLGGFEWIDCQYLSEHWKRFGARSISREELVKIATSGVGRGASFSAPRIAKSPELLGSLGIPSPAVTPMPVV